MDMFNYVQYFSNIHVRYPHSIKTFSRSFEILFVGVGFENSSFLFLTNISIRIYAFISGWCYTGWVLHVWNMNYAMFMLFYGYNQVIEMTAFNATFFIQFMCLHNINWFCVCSVINWEDFKVLCNVYSYVFSYFFSQ